MYRRFVCAERHPHARAELGLYQATELVDWDRQPDWLYREYREAWYFAKLLSVPPLLKPGQRRKQSAQSLCWLKVGGADWILGDIRHLAWTISEAGVPIREIQTRKPGMVLWEDDEQVVAVPNRKVPRAF